MSQNSQTHKKRTQGRPAGKSIQQQADARAALIAAARECFASKPYREVTTRMVAEKAGVNAALIRYYFINKDGLYQQMLTSVAEEFQATVNEFVNRYPHRPFEGILRAHKALASKNPDIPRLVFRELAFNEGQGRQIVIDNVANPNRRYMLKLFEGLSEESGFREDFDPRLFMFSILSMSIVPHLLKEVFLQMEGEELGHELMEKMIWQNAEMIQSGCFTRGKDHED